MGWRELLQAAGESVILPWVGGRPLRDQSREWHIEGALPPEHGWYTFRLQGRRAFAPEPAEPCPEKLHYAVSGYLVGNRFVWDLAKTASLDDSPQVYLIEEGLDRFSRIHVGQAFEDGPFIYLCQAMPLGPEPEVLNAYLDRKTVVDNLKNVTPALALAFKFETDHRAVVERRRAELERLRQEEEARRARAEHREKLVKQLGDSISRRELALVDFEAAARASLTVGGAELLDWKRFRKDENAVRFRLDGARYECICHAHTMQIVDAGICLTDHDTGETCDSWYTLESLPSVIREAERRRKLVVLRHV